MPTYYVRPDGNDLNVGTAPTNASGTGAFRTVNKALSVAVGGDTVWIAPGTYRENLTSAITGQTVNINFTGDATLTQVAWGTGLTAGVVRITNNLTNDTGTPSGVTLTVSSGRGPYVFTNLRFDGWMSLAPLSKNLTFNDCSFTGQCKETYIAVDNSQTTTYTVAFNRCTFHDVAFALDFVNNNNTVYQYVQFNSCLLTSCINIDRTTISSPAGTITNFWIMMLNGNSWDLNAYLFSNCTILPGRTQPNYLFAAWNWSNRGQLIIRNCLILSNPLTATFVQDRSQGVYYGWCAGYTLSSVNAASLGNNITLTSNPFDFGEAYLQDYKQYAPYTPIEGSVLANAGTTTQRANIAPPLFDFSNNTWTTANPTIGYMDSRAIATVPGAGGYVPLDRSIQTLTVTAGETGKSVHVYLGSTGVTFQTPNLTCYYARNNGTSVNIPLVAGNASTWVSGSLYEVSAVTMPGVYKFDIPNAVIESGASTASIMLRGANAFNGAFVNINIEQPAQSAYLSTNGYKLLSEYAGSDGVLTVNKRTVTTVKCQITDTNGTAVAVGASTMTVDVYSATNVLLASYTPTVQYAGNGHLTFVLDTQITGTAGTYNAYAIRTASATDRAVFGPLQIKVNEL